MKNISLHAPLNNTNRNWERALIKKANSGGSSLEKGTYAFTIYSIPEEALTQMPEPTLIPEKEGSQRSYSLYHIAQTPGSEENQIQTIGLIVLHDYNNLTLAITVISYTTDTTKHFVGVHGYNGTKPFNPRDIMLVFGDCNYNHNSQGWYSSTVPFAYIRDDDFSDTLDLAVCDFLGYEYKIVS